MGYGDKLKQNTDKIKSEEKIFDDKKTSKKAVMGRPKKSEKDVRNINVPTAYSLVEKEWIEAQAKELSKQLNIKVTASAWIRSKVLADMPKED